MIYPRDARLVQYLQINKYDTNINKKKDKNPSTDAEKLFDQILQPYMIETLNKLGLDGIYLNILKVMYYKHMDNIILDGTKP